jgi:hypothetical protein
VGGSAETAAPQKRLDHPLPDYAVPFTTTTEGIGLPSAVVFRESFTLELQPFLADCFRRAVWVWDYEQDRDLIAEESPDFVIDIFVERQLQAAPPRAFNNSQCH